MKWLDGLTWSEKVRRKQEWQRWFAWYPVIISITPGGRKVKVWWEYVERKGNMGYSGWDYCYREIGK